VWQFSCIDVHYRPELVPVEKETEVVFRLVIIVSVYIIVLRVDLAAVIN